MSPATTSVLPFSCSAKNGTMTIVSSPANLACTIVDSNCRMERMYPHTRGASSTSSSASITSPSQRLRIAGILSASPRTVPPPPAAPSSRRRAAAGSGAPTPARRSSWPPSRRRRSPPSPHPRRHERQRSRSRRRSTRGPGSRRWPPSPSRPPLRLRPPVRASRSAPVLHPCLRPPLGPVPVEGVSSDVEVNVLGLQVLAQGLQPQVVAGAALLVSAERRLRRVDPVLVDPDRPGLQPMRHAVCAPDVARPDPGRQPVAHVVRDPHRLVLTVERHDHDHRPEDLLLRDPHVV